ncbi:KAT8 regulatory NSL complex subunit 3 isoform X1 [Vespula squamosa]|uniref:KAT8 regulatory NSL complex subunit 3 isoform X1 n=1 Tax=Vespula squamosa TaxID=30214 RepID=A0ABD2AC59_VESSQ
MSSGLVSSTSLGSYELPSPLGDIVEDNSNKFTTYLHQLAGINEMEVDVILKDHSYARPWNWKPENIYVKPIKKLFFPKINSAGQDEEVDVERTDDEQPVPPLDLTRTRHVMDEFQRLANFARPDDNDDWEEKIDKSMWTSLQSRIFTKVIRILNSERLARLAKSNAMVEPIFRRTSVNTTARRFRETLASAGWDWRLTQWLHGLLFDHLSQEYLAIYLDILQTLRLKIPQLVDKMITVQPNINAKNGSITWETLGSLLKRTWDPIAPTLNNNRLKKLPGNPILIIAPSSIGSSISSRQHKWITQLGALGMVVNVHTHIGLAANRMTMMVCIDQLIQAIRAKIQDIKSDCPGRPIILVGFNTGAALACQVAQMEHVTAVICLGFPFSTVEGKRGSPDDTLLDIRCPVMFIIGQNASLVRPDDLEDLREKMLVETSLVVIGTADDYLRISTAKKISEGITQSMVDRCILEEIGDFVGSILLQPHPLPLRSISVTNCENKNNKKESRKRRNSTSSSVESEPNSPTLKISRPNTPVSTVSIGSNTSLAQVTRAGSFSTQPTLVTVTGQHINQSSTIRRKSRVISNPKAQFVEHLITSRVPTQKTTNSTSGGITLNIGSLASLAPIGPIRLGSSVDHTNTVKAINTSKSSITSNKIPKIISSNIPLQNVPKMKAIVSTNKTFSKVISSNYRHTNIIDKNGDTKLINVLTTGNQSRINPLSAAGHSKSTNGEVSGTLSTLLHNGKSTATTINGSPSSRISLSSSILLTPNISSTTNTAVTTSTVTKAMENRESSNSSQHVALNPTHIWDIPKISQLSSQTVSVSMNKDSISTLAGNTTAINENTQNTRITSSSVTAPFSFHKTGNSVAMSSQLKLSHNVTKIMPKITLNTNNLQRIQKGRSQTTLKKNIVNDIDDDLGNILDIPIIFAKDDDTLNNVEKVYTSQAADSKEKYVPKFSNTTKVVLISNKHDKLQHTSNKFVTPTTQTIICPNVPVQNMNHVILQTQSQSSVIKAKSRLGLPAQNRSNQPTIKYTKIILAKRNNTQSSQVDKNEQVLLSKTSQRLSKPKVCIFEKNDHKYTPSQIKYQENSSNDVIEIEDAIKTNIIERKYVTIPEIDLTSPTKCYEKETSNKHEVKFENKEHTEHTTFNSTTGLET